MAVGIICTMDLSMAPYVWFYADLCIKHNIDYTIIAKANSKIEKEGYNITTYIVTDSDFKKSRIRRVIDWYKWLSNTSKKNNITKYIVTPTNTAFLIAPLLLATSRPFIIDVRDYMGESKLSVRMLEKALFAKAESVIISSKGFKKWLPDVKTPIYTIHNMPLNATDFLDGNWSSNNANTVIGYIGYINYYDVNTKLITALSEFPKYSLQYSGKMAPSCKLHEFVKPDNHQVVFTGPFANEDKSGLYKQIDMINAIYGSKSLLVTTALPNKLYDGIIFKKPILAAKGTYLGEIVEKEKLGIAIDVFKDDIITVLDDFWNTFNPEEFNKNCNNYFNKILEEQNHTISKIVMFLKT